MFFAFLVSFLSFAYVNVGASLYISELLFAAYLFCSINKFRYLTESFPRKIIFLGSLWLFSQIVTDLIRDTSSEDFLRGWAAIVFFLIDFCALYVMVRKRPDVIRILILGSALGTFFSIIVLPTDFSEVEPWKFGYGYPVTMLVLLYLSNGNRFKSKSGLLLLVLLGMFSVYSNARSLGGMTVLTAVLLYLSKQPSLRSYATQRITRFKLIGIIGIALLSVIFIASVYQWSAESGYLPEKVTEKYQQGKNKVGGVLGIIVGGRGDILVASQAVIDSPIIGHGSWAKNPKYKYLLYEAIVNLGVVVDLARIKKNLESNDLIPAHSVILQAWIWAGLLGAVFWLYVLKFILCNMIVAIFSYNPLKPLILFIAIASIWNLLFSPFGANVRMFWGIYLMLFIVGTSQYEENKVIHYKQKEVMTK